MAFRAPPSGVSIDCADAAIVKGMLLRGDRQHDIASWFGVNAGRIAEIATGHRFGFVQPASNNRLPPPGPYLSGKDTAIVLQALEQIREAMNRAEELIQSQRP
jgi:hypothetical protein